MQLYNLYNNCSKCSFNIQKSISPVHILAEENYVHFNACRKKAFQHPLGNKNTHQTRNKGAYSA